MFKLRKRFEGKQVNCIWQTENTQQQTEKWKNFLANATNLVPAREALTQIQTAECQMTPTPTLTPTLTSHTDTAPFFCVYLPLNLLFQETPEDQRGAEENVTALDEDQVPDTQHTRHGKAGAEHGEKPLHGEDIGQRRLVGILHGSL